MLYHIKWVNVNVVNPEVGKGVFEASILGTTIMRLINDGKVIIQCEPI